MQNIGRVDARARLFRKSTVVVLCGESYEIIELAFVGEQAFPELGKSSATLH